MCERAFKSSGGQYNELDVVEIFCKNISKNANLQVSHDALLRTGCAETLERHKEHSLKDNHTYNIQHTSAKWKLPE